MLVQRVKDRTVQEKDLKNGWKFVYINNGEEKVYCTKCRMYVDNSIWGIGCWCSTLVKV